MSDRHEPGIDRRLDGLRAIAIGLVLLHHFAVLPHAETLLQKVLFSLPLAGFAGVDLFFVLSGFLITGILLRERESVHYWSAFYGRRILRIFPLYYLVCFVCFVLVPLSGLFAPADLWMVEEPRRLWPYLTFLSNYSMAATERLEHFVLLVTWSLAVEEQFYLVWPLLIRLLSGRALKWTLVGLLVGPTILRAYLHTTGASPFWMATSLPCRIDALAAGAMLAVLDRERGGFASLGRSLRWLLVAGSIGTVVTLAAIWYQHDLSGGESVPEMPFHPVMYTVGLVFLTMLGAAAIGYARSDRETWFTRLLASEPMNFIGRISYGLYLWHMLVKAILLWLVWKGTLEPTLGDAVLFMLAGIAGSIAISWLSYRFIEAPILRWKKHFPYRRAAVTPAGSGSPKGGSVAPATE